MIPLWSVQDVSRAHLGGQQRGVLRRTRWALQSYHEIMALGKLQTSLHDTSVLYMLITNAHHLAILILTEQRWPRNLVQNHHIPYEQFSLMLQSEKYLVLLTSMEHEHQLSWKEASYSAMASKSSPKPAKCLWNRCLMLSQTCRNLKFKVEIPSTFYYSLSSQ